MAIHGPPHQVILPTGTRLCDDACTLDGICADGGPGSEFNACAQGTDCADCGPRGLSTIGNNAFWEIPTLGIVYVPTGVQLGNGVFTNGYVVGGHQP